MTIFIRARASRADETKKKKKEKRKTVSHVSDTHVASMYYGYTSQMACEEPSEIHIGERSAVFLPSHALSLLCARAKRRLVYGGVSSAFCIFDFVVSFTIKMSLIASIKYADI